MVSCRLSRLLAVLVLTGGVLQSTLMIPQANGASEEQVKHSVGKGVAYLRGKIGSKDGGELALSALAMVKAGVPANDPDVARALAKISTRFRNGAYEPFDHHRYEAGVALMALASADPVAYKTQIEGIARYILDSQESHGGWYYPPGHGGVGLAAGANQHGDTSITQYTLLGLWEASRAGVPIPKKAFDRAAAWHLQTQLRDGSFAYHPSTTAFNPQGTHSMAVAGTASLLLTRMMLYPDAKELPLEEIEEEDPMTKAAKKKKREIKFGILIPAADDIKEPEPSAAPEEKRKPLPDDDPGYKPTTKLANVSNGSARGLKWLAANFKADLLGGAQAQQLGQQWNAYYLYGVERLAALSGLAEIGGHDWYQEGSDFLLARQTSDGSWNMDQAGQDADTCFAVMFLVKATEKTLKKTPRRRRDPKMGGGILIGARGLPEDLSKLQPGGIGPKPRKVKGAVDQLLVDLSKLDGDDLAVAQETIVDTVLTENPEALVGQQKRLEELSRDRKPEVRRTAVWALGRTNNLSSVPYILERLSDVDLSVIIEARNALRFMTRKPEFLELSETPSTEELIGIARQARKWYLSVRPYSERDDLEDLKEVAP